MESKLEAKLKKKIEALGGQCFKWVSPGKRGVPDRIIFMPGGKIYLVETKWGENGLSPQQKYIRKILSLLGIHVYVASNEEELSQFLNEVQTL